MTSAALQPLNWKLSRWLALIALVFSSQLLLIYLLSFSGDHPTVASRTTAAIQLFTAPMTETQFSEIYLASDPTLFATANRHGFSGAAWLKFPTRKYDLSERVESPFWLPLKSEQLGSALAQFVRTNAAVPLSIVEKVAPKIFASPVIDLTSNTKSNSQIRVEGDLASRNLIETPKLQSWAASEILSNTVAQVTVDGRGTVLSVRLLSRSGLVEADHAALDIARNVQFVPIGENKPTAGKLIFDWHTFPLAVINSTNEIPSPNAR